MIFRPFFRIHFICQTPCFLGATGRSIRFAFENCVTKAGTSAEEMVDVPADSQDEGEQGA